jgi:N-acetylglutamate synthase-like GNAT family acetyltransferase
MPYTIRAAQHPDYKDMLALLQRLDLTIYGVLFPGTMYWIAVDDDTEQIIGVIGIEPGLQQSVLLRSAGIAPEVQKQGIGRALTEAVYAWCRANELRTVYCFSTDAQEYWSHMGFRRVEMEELLSVLGNAPQTLHFDGLGWLPTEVVWRRDL